MSFLPGGVRSVAVALAVVLIAACGASPSTAPVTDGPPGSPAVSGSAPGVSSGPSGTSGVVPSPGHELYGYVPYWEMDAGIVGHVASTPLSTLALFSVTNTSKGALSQGQIGYRRITGDMGSALIAAAHAKGMRVELVFSSFGASRNAAFFARTALQDATIAALVTLVGTLEIEGVNVDVEGLDIASAGVYGAFVGRLRNALVAADPGDTVSVATGPGPTGAAMAAAALAAGANRVFLMGYDYRTDTSAPGATAPITREDGGRSISWSLDLYAAAGIPPERLLLGLPLYGRSWPVIGPVIGTAAMGDGDVWILRRHADVLANPAAVPIHDDVEAVDVYFLGSDGSLTPPPWDGSPPPAGVTWTGVWVDSPATLERKLGLGAGRGLVGAGFWAVGYERGLPGYTALMRRFVAGDVPAP